MKLTDQFPTHGTTATPLNVAYTVYFSQVLSFNSIVRKDKCVLASSSEYHQTRHGIRSLIRCMSLCLHVDDCVTVTYRTVTQLCILSSVCELSQDCDEKSISVTGIHKPGQCEFMLVLHNVSVLDICPFKFDFSI